MTKIVERKRKKLQELRQNVEADGFVRPFPMWKLRDACGYGRLGVHVVQDIAARLRAVGLGYLPAGRDLPRDQYATVHLYLRDSPVGEVVEAVLHPSEAGDARLREAAGSDAAEILQQIRALVCE